MKKLFLALLFFTSLCIVAFAQTSKTPRCPKVSVKTSFIGVIDGYPMTFIARITGVDAAKVQYKWTVSGGEITEGQGTPEIKVDTLGFAGEEIKATLIVRGLPERCKNKASTAGFVKPKLYLNQDRSN